MKVMTFNLKDDSFNIFSNWKKRLQEFINLVNEQKPDIIGTQEMTYKAKKILEKNLNKQYNFYGESRKRTNRILDEYNCILVKKNIKVKNNYTYSLSETPKKPKSKLKKDLFPRIMTYIETDNYYIYNTHLTNKNDNNKFVQLDIIANLIKNDKPIIITGDFNLGIARIKNFCEKNNLVDTTKNIKITFENKKKKYHLDHILVSKNIKFDKAIKHKNDYIRLSDHYPISTNIKL